ncbi:hypothetical protein F5Y00DRAFT_233519 [Daldinia vernicosa]|uniref:uncharacterized protein n=1 Tax=Daldinia vernicosa TaxID=114800 RepID=UPI002008ACAC|nr:uncharacterized protein F5Y00DRAFT_233519 [Daldinia vernicosa]KAI0850067.1 hypothetical protein F5Y00DRAFT_233519 [Daldinia vernicosa]
MCNEVYLKFRGCGHRVWQNTFACDIARRGDPKNDMVLDKTKSLPDKRPKLPPGMLCERRKCVRPTDAPCPLCAEDKSNGNAPGKSARVLETIPEHVDGA